MTSEQIKKAKEVSIISVMRNLGCETKRYGGLYRVPWRSESRGSLKIFPVTSKGSKTRWHEEWHDFGANKGGSVIDFVMNVNNCGFDDAVKWLLNMENIPYSDSSVEDVPTGEKGLEVKSVGKITDSDLRQYAKGRCIASCVLDEYCVQVAYTPRNHPNWTFRAIGLKNDCGEYELNGYSYKTGRKFKGVTGAKDITSLLSGKSKLLIFEGMFNFLSLFSMPEWYQYRNDYDIVILNSVSNVGKALTKLSSLRYDKVGFLLDEDDAGRECREKLQGVVISNVKQNVFKDMFFDRYPDFCTEYSRTHDGATADLNDIWIHICEERHKIQ